MNALILLVITAMAALFESVTVLSIGGTQVLAWRDGALFIKVGSDWQAIPTLPARLQ